MPCTLQARTAQKYVALSLSLDSAVKSCTGGSESKTPLVPVSEFTSIPLTNCKPKTSQGAINPPSTQHALISPVLPLSATLRFQKKIPDLSLYPLRFLITTHIQQDENATDTEKNISDVTFIDSFKLLTLSRIGECQMLRKKYPTF